MGAPGRYKNSTYVLHRIDDSHSPDANYSYTHEQVDYFFFVIGEAIWRFGEANMCERARRLVGRLD